MKYLVDAVITIDASAEVEADSIEEATRIAQGMSGADFDEDGMTDGENVSVTNVTEIVLEL